MKPVTLFVCGDVMTGRGIDQVMPHPSDPVIHEPYMDSALGYVALAEQANGPIPRAVTPEYIWGDALAEFDRIKPQARIVNLETAITTSQAWQPKGINYRMHPRNIDCLTAAAIDCCVLANNHVLDWGAAGLRETLATLRAAGIATAGAGENQVQAWAPAVLPLANGARLLVFSVGLPSSGVPPAWATTGDAPGVAFVPDLSDDSVARIVQAVQAHRRAGDIVLVSVHWGGNWGYGISAAEAGFAHALVERGVDIFHGHSSHHPKAIEVYRDRMILYGCGDFINDYEGISGHEAFRGDLSLMYFPQIEPDSGRLLRLQLVPMQMRRLRAQRASDADAQWLRELVDREGRRFGTRAQHGADGCIELRWR
jgi:poly-gamma-glutamate capsule biosynthesis protein CapA/YwtB (metallophosphatase superfamily)